MTLKYPHLSSRAFTRSACAVAVVGLVAFGTVTSASAATSHFTPLSGSPIDVSGRPQAVAFDSNINPRSGHKQVYVAGGIADNVIVIDATTRLVTDILTTGRGVNTSALAVDERDHI